MYRGAFVYRRGADSSLTLESAGFSGGRLTGASVLMYATDYLGSVRAVVDGRTGELYKAVDYSSYGEETIVEAAGVSGGITLRDGYTGKENQHPDFGTSHTDFGARQYHPQLHRWMTPDPLSEKYYGISPYAFCNNDPVNFVDLDGEGIYSIDPDGKISKINDDEKVHQLYLVDKDGNTTGKMIELSNSEAMEFLKYEKGKEIYSYTTSEGNIDNVFKIFKFAADNTKVEWALHRGQGNVYTLGTSLNDSMVDSYFTMTGEESLPIASIHSHPNTTDLTTMGYSLYTYSTSDQWKVNNSIAPKLNYVYFPKSRSLYLAGQYSPYYIRKIEAYQDFYFGTLNHR